MARERNPAGTSPTNPGPGKDTPTRPTDKNSGPPNVPKPPDPPKRG